MGELVLASRSPQRRAILAQLGVRFVVDVPEVVELSEGEPRAVVHENSLRKGRAVEGELVLGVDTAVVFEGRAYGKPAGREEAEAGLRRLAGREHEVLSAVALIGPDGRERTGLAETKVRFRALSDELLAWYLDSGEWRDRAGGYAIQGRGAALVAGIEGDYLNVVGLPVVTLLGLAPELLEGAGGRHPWG